MSPFLITLWWAFLQVGIDGKITLSNRWFLELLGYLECELATMNMRDLTHPDDVDSFILGVHKMLDGHSSVYTEEKRFLKKTEDSSGSMFRLS
jgi:PAS domain S-box-containing protein